MWGLQEAGGCCGHPLFRAVNTQPFAAIMEVSPASTWGGQAAEGAAEWNSVGEEEQMKVAGAQGGGSTVQDPEGRLARQV